MTMWPFRTHIKSTNDAELPVPATCTFNFHACPLRGGSENVKRVAKGNVILFLSVFVGSFATRYIQFYMLFGLRDAFQLAGVASWLEMDSHAVTNRGGALDTIIRVYQGPTIP
jgi:hypothetical protein